MWAYGSRVTGKCHDTSDLDIVLRNPKDLTKPFDKRYDLIEAIQHSALPILVEVHDWALLPKQFHTNIENAYFVIQQPK